MAYLKINLFKILKNYEKLRKICGEQNIELVPVTKCLSSDAALCRSLYEAGCKMVADSHWQNFALWDDRLPLKRMLLQVSPSQITPALKHSDILMVSDLEILSRISRQVSKTPARILLPVETGEGRDGVLPEELPEFLKNARALPGIQIESLALIFGCMKGFFPAEEDLFWAKTFSRSLAENPDAPPLSCSAGGTIFTDFLFQGKLSGMVNQIRMGEAIFLGFNTYTARPISGLDQDGVVLGAEILEVREKEEDFYHHAGLNSFGIKMPFQRHRCRRKQAVLDVGFIYSAQGQMADLPPGVEFLFNSHDHSVVDVTHAQNPWKAGDCMEFTPRYDLVSYCMGLPYIEKFYTQI